MLSFWMYLLVDQWLCRLSKTCLLCGWQNSITKPSMVGTTVHTSKLECRLLPKQSRLAQVGTLYLRDGDAKWICSVASWTLTVHEFFPSLSHIILYIKSFHGHVQVSCWTVSAGPGEGRALVFSGFCLNIWQWWLSSSSPQSWPYSKSLKKTHLNSESLNETEQHRASDYRERKSA